jgi:hypothetical protein
MLLIFWATSIFHTLYENPIHAIDTLGATVAWYKHHSWRQCGRDAHPSRDFSQPVMLEAGTLCGRERCLRSRAFLHRNIEPPWGVGCVRSTLGFHSEGTPVDTEGQKGCNPTS